MNHTTRSMTALGGLVLSASLIVQAPAGALADDAEAQYSRYHQAIEVAKLCRDAKFDQAAHDAMAGVINGRIGNRIGAKRLSLLTAAQRESQALVDREGCKGAGAQGLLALFDSDLAPALP